MNYSFSCPTPRLIPNCCQWCRDALTTSMTWALHLDSSCSPRKARSKSSLYSSSDFWLSSPEPVTTWKTPHHVRATISNLLQGLHSVNRFLSQIPLEMNSWPYDQARIEESIYYPSGKGTLARLLLHRQSNYSLQKKRSLTYHLRANNWLFLFHFPTPFQWSNTTEILENPWPIKVQISSYKCHKRSSWECYDLLNWHWWMRITHVQKTVPMASERALAFRNEKNRDASVNFPQSPEW